jgi:signal transduction histidine kinase
MFIFFLLLLFVLIGTTIKDSYQVHERLFYENLKNKALTIFNLMVDIRHWNAKFDGVYIKSEELEPNPYLTPNFILSQKGEKLVWVNPAFMTRQISEIASTRDGFKLKITSNKLINQNNAPDEYEQKVLENFDKNPEVPYYWTIENNVFKFMGALKTEQDCLKCHAHQGYKVGEVRGAISVFFDASNEIEQLNTLNKDKEQTIIFLILASIGTIISFIIYQRLREKDEKKISNLNQTLELKVKELDEFNQTLHNKVQQEVIKQREKENLLIQQSKLAALGEMIGNIAHQWRQPISAVSAIMMNIKWTALDQGLNTKFLDERMQEANDQLKYMSQTIDDFSNFFKPNKEKSYFDIKEACRKAIKILNATLQHHNINLQLFSSKDMIAYGYANEFSQVVLNLISNAKDVLIERHIQKPRIEIHIHQDEQFVYCEVHDNAKGISAENMDRVFEPYFTTKGVNGTGIGLYIAKEIIHKHMKGTLKVKNNDNGAVFIIKIPKKDI